MNKLYKKNNLTFVKSKRSIDRLVLNLLINHPDLIAFIKYQMNETGLSGTDVAKNILLEKAIRWKLTYKLNDSNS